MSSTNNNNNNLFFKVIPTDFYLDSQDESTYQHIGADQIKMICDLIGAKKSGSSRKKNVQNIEQHMKANKMNYGQVRTQMIDYNKVFMRERLEIKSKLRSHNNKQDINKQGIKPIDSNNNMFPPNLNAQPKDPNNNTNGLPNNNNNGLGNNNNNGIPNGNNNEFMSTEISRILLSQGIDINKLNLNKNTHGTPANIKAIKNSIRTEILKDNQNQFNNQMNLMIKKLEGIDNKTNDNLNFVSGMSNEMQEQLNELRNRVNHQEKEINNYNTQIINGKNELEKVRIERDEYEKRVIDMEKELRKFKLLNNNTNKNLENKDVIMDNSNNSGENKSDANENDNDVSFDEIFDDLDKQGLFQQKGFDVDAKDKLRVIKISFPNSKGINKKDFMVMVAKELKEKEVDGQVEKINKKKRIRVKILTNGIMLGQVFFINDTVAAGFKSKCQNQTFRVYVDFWQNDDELNQKRSTRRNLNNYNNTQWNHRNYNRNNYGNNNYGNNNYGNNNYGNGGGNGNNNNHNNDALRYATEQAVSAAQAALSGGGGGYNNGGGYQRFHNNRNGNRNGNGNNYNNYGNGQRNN